MRQMWFERVPSLKLYVLATVFCSKILVSKCRAGDTLQVFDEPRDSEESIQTYNTEMPWPPVPLDPKPNNFAIMAWVAVLSVAVFVGAVICFCCMCWKLSFRDDRRRQSTNAALFLTPTTASRVRFSRDRTRRGNNQGIRNMAFTGGLQDSISCIRIDDRPPPYSTVISSVINDKSSSVPFSQVGEAKPVETPPPAYITIAPFQ